jgi:hypothetical protein
MKIPFLKIYNTEMKIIGENKKKTGKPEAFPFQKSEKFSDIRHQD